MIAPQLLALAVNGFPEDRFDIYTLEQPHARWRTMLPVRAAMPLRLWLKSPARARRICRGQRGAGPVALAAALTVALFVAAVYNGATLAYRLVRTPDTVQGRVLGPPAGEAPPRQQRPHPAGGEPPPTLRVQIRGQPRRRPGVEAEPQGARIGLGRRLQCRQIRLVRPRRTPGASARAAIPPTAKAPKPKLR